MNPPFPDLDRRRDVAAPVFGNEIEHGRLRLPLELGGLEVAEPPPQPFQRDCVAERDRHVLLRERVELVPPPPFPILLNNRLQNTKHQKNKKTKKTKKRNHSSSIPNFRSAKI